MTSQELVTSKSHNSQDHHGDLWSRLQRLERARNARLPRGWAVSFSCLSIFFFKGAVSRYSVIFCAFFARAKNGGCSRKCRGHHWKLGRPRGLAAWPPTLAACWHDSAVNQRQVEPELHCFTCRRRQAALLFSGYEARARWYPLLQGSRLAATAISISILYSRVWFCAPSEACFGDLVSESMGDWEKESAVWS